MKLPDWTRRFRKVVHTAFQRVGSWTRGVVRFVWAKRGWLVLLVLAVAIAAGIWNVINYWDSLSTTFWDWLRDGPDRMESGSTTVRNLGLVIAGVIALPLAIWRSIVAQRQANTAQQTLLNERYQQGAEMLGNDLLTVRLGGIYALQRLAEEHPEQYHIQIMRLFCAFARHPTEDESVGNNWVPADLELSTLRTDIQDVVKAISACHGKQIKLDRDANFRLELSGANLAGVYLVNANLANANLHGVNLSDAQLTGGNLSGATFWDTNLRGANLKGGDLSGATFWDSNLSDANLNLGDLSGVSIGRTEVRHTRFWRTELSGTEFSLHNGGDPATGLTQARLDKARADPDNPPKLDGVVDAETGEQLVWHGKPLDTL